MAITTGLIVALFPAFVFPWLQSLDDPDSIAEQLRKIRTVAAEENLTTVVARRIDLQRSGQFDHLLVFRDRSLSSSSNERQRTVSDEIRVYTEERDGELRQTFNFQPLPLKSIYSIGYFLKALRQPDRYKIGPGVPLTFEVATIRDLDGNDRPEVLGAYFQRHMTDEDPIPVVLAWTDFAGGYELYPLLTKAPRLRRLAAGLYGSSKRRRYRLPIMLEDRGTGEKMHAFMVQGFGVAETATGQPGLVTSFLGRSPSHAEPLSVEVKLSVVSYEEEPITYECGYGKVPDSIGEARLYQTSKLIPVHPEAISQLSLTGHFKEVPINVTDDFHC